MQPNNTATTQISILIQMTAFYLHIHI